MSAGKSCYGTYAEARYRFSQSSSAQCNESIFYDICKTWAMKGKSFHQYFYSREGVVRNKRNGEKVETAACQFDWRSRHHLWL